MLNTEGIGPEPTQDALIDAYSRASLPASVSEIVSVILNVHYKSDTSQWTIEINDQQKFKIQRIGRYDVTGHAQSIGAERKMYARAVPTAGGGTGIISYMLELVVRI